MNLKNKLFPLILTLSVILADQISKIIVARLLPFAQPVEVFGDFLRLTYVTNQAIAFSIGRNMAGFGRVVMSLILPLMVLGILFYYYFFSRDIAQNQRWILAAIIGGGMGNYADRLFRSGGVIDFIDVKFYGIFGLIRWPTFNLADSAVVVAGFLLLINFLRKGVKEKNE